MPWFTDSYGNASGGHRLAREARRAVDEARESTAELLGCGPGELVFTGGGTEADNTAVAGFVAAAVRSGSPSGVVCSAVEHHAVLHAVDAVGGRTAPVDADGRIDLDGLASTLGPDVGLVSVMLANNEIGTIQDLDAIGRVLEVGAPRAVLHTDAVQAAPWLDLRRAATAASLVSIAAHKFGGPQGVGALIVRRGLRIEPLLRGGGQERELRSGTHNVAGIVGLAAAFRAAADGRDAAVERVRALRDTLVSGIRARVPGVTETAAGAPRLPNIAHLRFAGVENESVLMLLDDAGVCAAAGSSCASGAMEPSHVLAAIGLSRPEARSALRFSLGHTTTAEEIAGAVETVAAVVSRLRSATVARA